MSKKNLKMNVLTTYHSDFQNQGSRIPLNHIEFNRFYDNYAKIM